MKLYELFQAENVRMAYENDTNRPPYLFEAMFPVRRQKGLKFEFIKGKQGTPVALVSANFNSNVLYRDRIAFDVLSGQLPFFKEALAIDEVTRQEILSTKPEYVQPLVDKVFNDQVELLDSAEVTMERMRGQLLSTGTISIVENGVNKQYDYGFDETTQFVDDKTEWGKGALASMASQVEAYNNSEKHANPAQYIIISRPLFVKLGQDEAILEHFRKLSNPIAYPTQEQKKEYIETSLGVTLVVVSKKFKEARDFNGNAKYFYDEDRYTILSTLDLGETVMGTTPEEADILGKNSGASSCAVTNKGVCITMWNEIDPVNVNTKVSEVGIPTFEAIDTIQIVKVA